MAKFFSFRIKPLIIVNAKDQRSIYISSFTFARAKEESGPREDLKRSDLQEIIELHEVDWTLIDLRGNWKLNFIADAVLPLRSLLKGMIRVVSRSN